MFLKLTIDQVEILRAKKRIARHRLMGLSVVAFDNDGKVSNYWIRNGRDSWFTSNDTNSAEYPYLFVKIAAAFNCQQRLTETGFPNVALALWIHDDIGLPAREKWMRCQFELPGNVSQ